MTTVEPTKVRDIYDILADTCKEQGLSCYTGELMKAAAPLAVVPAVLGAALAVSVYVLRRWSWNTDIREHCQSIMNRQQFFNATFLTIGAIASALFLIKSASVALSVTASATVLGGIWLTVGVCVALNSLLHSRMVEQNAMRMV